MPSDKEEAGLGLDDEFNVSHVELRVLMRHWGGGAGGGAVQRDIEDLRPSPQPCVGWRKRSGNHQPMGVAKARRLEGVPRAEWVKGAERGMVMAGVGGRGGREEAWGRWMVLWWRRHVMR